MKTGKIILAAVAAFSFSASPALAYEAECMNGGAKRVIRVNLNPAEGVACDVQYAVNDESETRLWWANWEKGFCEERARELAAKLREGGYECAEKDD